jgi:hypothetical protein
MTIKNDTECLIYPHLSGDDKLVIGVRSVELNANCAVSIRLNEEDVSKILYCLEKAETDMIMAKMQGALVKDTKCNPCIIKDGKCLSCGEAYK